MPTIPQTIIRFPEIKLEKRDAHKMRGYFGSLFQERSPLLHNHFADGSLRYLYPLVQYKVINETPTLVGLAEGANLLTKLFLDITELNIDGRVYPLFQKNLDQYQVEVGLSEELHSYRFENLWMALNQKNNSEYIACQTQSDKDKLLNRILENNLLSFYKGVGIWLKGHLMAKGKFKESKTQLKNNTMKAFSGDFTANCLIPDHVGIGKSVSRGFGSLLKV